MLDSEPHQVRVSADRGSFAAGRDIHESHNVFHVHRGGIVKPPRWDSPDLIACPHCGRPWVSRLAAMCPSCHYNLGEMRKVRVEGRLLVVQLVWMGILLAFISMLSLLFMGDRPLGLPRAVFAVPALCGMVSAWATAIFVARRNRSIALTKE